MFFECNSVCIWIYIYRHPEKIHGKLGPGGSHKYMYFEYTLYSWISRDIPWMACWFALPYIYKRTSDNIPIPWMAWWYTLLYMYFGYTLYPWMSRDIPWIVCIHEILEIFHGWFGGTHYCTCTYTSDIHTWHGSTHYCTFNNVRTSALDIHIHVHLYFESNDVYMYIVCLAINLEIVHV